MKSDVSSSSRCQDHLRFVITDVRVDLAVNQSSRVNSRELQQELQECEKLQRLSTIKAGGVTLLLYGFMASLLLPRARV